MQSFQIEFCAVLFFTLVSIINSVWSIDCYQCNSTDHVDPFQCGEYMTDDIDIEPKSCDEVYGAAYCIKHTGRFEGDVSSQVACGLGQHVGVVALLCMMHMALCMPPGHIARGISCYQCASTTNIDCGNQLIHDTVDSSLQPTSCGYLFEARYCVKATGLHSGGLGTKRFCSSLDLGNYCNYIKQPGDVMEYRSCVYTCDSDGCNASTPAQRSHLLQVFLPSALLIVALGC